MKDKLARIPDIKKCAWCGKFYEERYTPPAEKGKFYWDDLMDLCLDCRKLFYKELREAKDAEKKEE